MSQSDSPPALHLTASDILPANCAFLTTLRHQTLASTRHGAAQPPAVTAGAANTGHARRRAMGGKIDKIKGRIKEAVGVLADDDNLQREGQLDQVVGEVKEQAGRVVEKVKEQVAKAVKKVKNA